MAACLIFDPGRWLGARRRLTVTLRPEQWAEPRRLAREVDAEARRTREAIAEELARRAAEGDREARRALRRIDRRGRRGTRR